METNVIYCGDNVEVLPKYVDPDSVDLIYIDPPFNTSRNYEVFWGEGVERRAFEDRYGDAMAYLDWMRPRLVQLYRALKTTGSFYYHCDWHASHYIKVELDRLFGANNFQNEIVWRRTTGHRDSRRWNQAHDTILFYSKSRKFVWNPQYEPYDETYIRDYFSQADPDGRRYMADNLLAAGIRKGESGKPWHGIDPTITGNHWQYTVQGLEELDAAGRIHWPKKRGGNAQDQAILGRARWQARNICVGRHSSNRRSRERASWLPHPKASCPPGAHRRRQLQRGRPGAGRLLRLRHHPRSRCEA
jgi:hypothetical protein